MNTNEQKAELKVLRERALRFEQLSAKFPGNQEIELKYVRAELAAERLENTINRVEIANLKVKLAGQKPSVPDGVDWASMGGKNAEEVFSQIFGPTFKTKSSK